LEKDVERGKKFVELDRVTRELDQLEEEFREIGERLEGFAYHLKERPTSIYFKEDTTEIIEGMPRFSHSELKGWIDNIRDKIKRAKDLKKEKGRLERELKTKVTPTR